MLAGGTSPSAAPRRARHHAGTPITAQWVLQMSTLGMTTATSPSAAYPSPCLETPDAGIATWRPPRGRIAPVPRRTKRCLACNPGSLMTLPGTGSSAHGDPHSPGTMRRSPRALRPSPTAALPQTDAGVMAPAQWPRIRPSTGGRPIVARHPQRRPRPPTRVLIVLGTAVALLALLVALAIMVAPRADPRPAGPTPTPSAGPASTASVDRNNP